MNAPVLQNNLQRAVVVASQTLTTRLAEAVLEHTDEDGYQPGSELFQIAQIRDIAGDANRLSIILSDAYRLKKLGRVNWYGGRERFAYGPPGPAAGGTPPRRKKVIEAPPKKVVGYELTREFYDADEALEYVIATGGRVELVGGSGTGWAVHVRYDTAFEALQSVATVREVLE